MKTLCVIQHAEAEYLGLMEDHFEGRNIRFSYQRPFAAGGAVPAGPSGYDGLILLGGGPYGVVSGHLLPSFSPELRLTRAFLDAGLPVIGIGVGTLILTVATGGGVEEAPLRFTVETATATDGDALGGPSVRRFPLAVYMRDRPVLPAGARVLAAGEDGAPLVFAPAERSLAFLGHPGMKRGMAEDLVMEFADVPDDTAETLAKLGAVQAAIADALSELMIGIGRQTALCQ